MRRQRAFIGTLAALLYLWAAVVHALSSDNTAVGYAALSGNTAGLQNTAVGAFTLGANNQGNSNTALGYNSLSNNINSHYNTAVGHVTLVSNRTGNSNTAVGQGALYTNTSGADNTALGTDALSSVNGSGNIAIGRSAGRAVWSGDNNIYIGHPGVSSESGVIRIGDERHDRTLLTGDVGIGTQNPGAELDVVGTVQASTVAITSDIRLKTHITPLTEVLAKLAQLRGVSFEWNDTYKALGRATGRREIGVLAQDVEAVFPELVTTSGAGYKAVDYGKLSGVLIEAVKELQATTEAQLATKDAHIVAVEARLAEMNVRLEALERGVAASRQTHAGHSVPVQWTSVGLFTSGPFVGGLLMAGLAFGRRWSRGQQ